jgi:hypothetical protein
MTTPISRGRAKTIVCFPATSADKCPRSMLGQPINPSILHPCMDKGRSTATSIRKERLFSSETQARHHHHVVLPRKNWGSRLGSSTAIISGTPRVPQLTGLAKLPYVYSFAGPAAAVKKLPRRPGAPSGHFDCLLFWFNHVFQVDDPHWLP